MAAATAVRTGPPLGSSERCSIDANKASAQTALLPGRYISSCISQPPDRFAPRTYDAGETVAGREPAVDEWRSRRPEVRAGAVVDERRGAGGVAGGALDF